MNENYVVYVKINESNSIIEINSSEFINDISGWIQIDEGVGDKYHHAQGNYFDMSLYDMEGCANYKLVDGKPELRTAEEKQVEISNRPAPPPTEEDRIKALEESMLTLMTMAVGK